MKKRIAMTKTASTRRGKLLQKRLKDGDDTCLECISFGWERWTLRKEDVKRIRAFEMWIWRKMEKISWTAHVSDEKVLSLVQEQRSLVHIINHTTLSQMDRHVLRHDCLLKTVLGGNSMEHGHGKNNNNMLYLLMEKENKKISYQEVNRSWTPDRMASSLIINWMWLRQSTQEEIVLCAL